ncbi:hypothetical protein [Serratia quinivorans]|uniref:hypothetical protein n=1 Tax=Serratia quinivorans TaxID=137545 RepID=UPI001C44AAEF|nr:hypothetical protein [Serratia quinivorans]MBV6695138.1 hypothetical protein [Serratia quinivorans]
MTIFRKAVLERKKNNITGVPFDDTETWKMKSLIFFMLIISMATLFISQETVKVHIAAKISSPPKEFQIRGHCFRLEYESTKEDRVAPDELIGFFINKKDHLTGTVIHVGGDNIFCAKLTKKINTEIPEIELGKTVYLWKYEKIWIFLYNKIKGSTGL